MISVQISGVVAGIRNGHVTNTNQNFNIFHSVH